MSHDERDGERDKLVCSSEFISRVGSSEFIRYTEQRLKSLLPAQRLKSLLPTQRLKSLLRTLMYEYRKLSDSEREEIQRYRIQQGYPLHAPPHRHQEHGHFLISAAIFEHKDLISSPARRTEFEIRLIEGFNQNGCEVHAWVVLPNHYHVLLNTKSFESISIIVKRLHGSTSRNWNLQDGVTGRKVWFNYSDRKIRSERHFFASLNYIHHNSVKHGYVKEATDWPWSSIHLYLADHGPDWVFDVKDRYPILDYGRNWDD